MSNVLRKIIALLLAVCMVTLCACHVDKNDESSERESSSRTEDSSQTEQVEIVFREGENEDGATVLTNDDIVSAEAQAIKYPADDVLDYVVVLTLNDEGSEAFAKATQRLAEEQGIVSVWVDGECVSAPKVLEAITDGKVVITGNFTYDEAKALAGKING